MKFGLPDTSRSGRFFEEQGGLKIVIKGGVCDLIGQTSRRLTSVLDFVILTE